MRRSVPVLLTAVLAVFPLGSVRAQGPRPSNSLQFRLGGFFPRGGGDIWGSDEQTFTLERSDFNGGIAGFTYAMSINNLFEMGFNLDFYDETARSQDRDYVDQSGLPILHDTRLELIPLTVDFRFLPAGRYGIRGGQRRVLHPVPYLGGGVGVNYWEYEEVGDFVNGPHPPQPGVDGVIFPARFIESGTAFETHVLTGLELPFNPRFSFLLEGRYSWSDVTPNGDFAGLGNLDLSGFAGYLGFAYHF